MTLSNFVAPTMVFQDCGPQVIKKLFVHRIACFPVDYDENT